MSAIASTPIDAEAKNAPTSGRLFFLDLSAGRILSANPDGSDLKTIINEGRNLPDGLALDVAAGHIYWTNMGDPKRNDGSIMRSDLNGKNMITIVPLGGTFTPKQLQLEKRSGKLCWSDREGMRVMRANLAGSEIETIVDTSLGDSRPGSEPTKWCVGIAVDTEGGKFYWTQRVVTTRVWVEFFGPTSIKFRFGRLIAYFIRRRRTLRKHKLPAGSGVSSMGLRQTITLRRARVTFII
jgi:Low-density lipoprotein receptor repeat class B